LRRIKQQDKPAALPRFWNISNAQDALGPEIRISGRIGSWEDFNFARFEEEFRALWDAGRPIAFRINSMGGDVFESMAIYDLVRMSPVPTIATVNGMAASAAGWIFQACSIRRMTPNSFLMMHKVQGCGCGTSGELRETAQMSDKLEGKIVQIYRERSGKSRAVVESWFREQGETWFDAQECVRLGLADEVLPPAHEEYLPVIHQNRFQMDFKNQVSKALGLDSSDEAELAARVASLAVAEKAASQREESLRNQVKELQAKVKLYEQTDSDRRQALENKAKSQLEGMMADGILTKGQKDIFSSLAAKDPQMVMDLMAEFGPPQHRSLTADLSAARAPAQSAGSHASYGDAVSAYLSSKHKNQPA
jgi:ATP-dependent protease ClpP protease subunit